MVSMTSRSSYDNDETARLLPGSPNESNSTTVSQLYLNKYLVTNTASKVQQDVPRTSRLIIIGLIIGTFLCGTNTYFGLQTGHPAGFTFPLAVLCRLFRPSMTVVETTVVVVTATTVAGSPIVAGLVGPIPALEFLTRTKDQAHINFGWSKILAWAIGVSLFGPFLAMKLRERFLGRDAKEKMRFPTARAIS